MKGVKPILPSLREKKRYLVFEIISKDRISSFKAVNQAIWSSLGSIVGDLGMAEMGIWVLPDKYNPANQTGVIRVSHKHVDTLKACLTFVGKVDKKDVIVRSLNVSGMLSKTKQYLAG